MQWRRLLPAMAQHSKPLRRARMPGTTASPFSRAAPALSTTDGVSRQALLTDSSLAKSLASQAQLSCAPHPFWHRFMHYLVLVPVV